MPNRFPKSPTASLDYSWDWTDWLAGVSDTIGSATVTVPAGLTAVGVPVFNEMVVTQEVSGGALDGTYKMLCQITTAAGRIDTRSITLIICER